MKTLLAILKKEFRQFGRNKFLPRLVLVFPVAVMLILPLTTSMEVRHVGVAVVDNDGKHFSRLLIDKIGASSYLQLAYVGKSYADALSLLEQQRADVIVEIPRDFSSRRGQNRINISANAVNGTKGSLGMQYVMSIVSGTIAAESPVRGSQMMQAVQVRYLYNPTLNYRHFMIPALTTMLLVMLCGFLPALNIVGEKEKGTIEQINVTPISPLLFVLGKLLPYWMIGVVVFSVAMLIGHLVYGLAPHGMALPTVYLAALLFIVVMSSIGVVIAGSSDRQQQVMFVMFFVVVVFILMSGLMTPVASMPLWARKLTLVIPPRYFIDIMRSAYLRGATLADLSHEFTVLAAMAVVAAVVAVTSVRKR